MYTPLYDHYAALHTHNEASHDGFGSIEKLIDWCVSMGMKHVALTNHDKTDFLLDFSLYGKEKGIKTIPGIEAYYMPFFDNPKKDNYQYYHMGLLVKNDQGLKNFNRMLSVAAEKNFFYRRHVTDALLREYHDGLIALSGCISSYPAKQFIAGRIDLAIDHIARMNSLFEGDYYLEVQPFEVYLEEDKYPQWAGIDVQAAYNKWILSVGHYLEISVVVTTDSHYIEERQRLDHRTALKLRTRKDTLANYDKRYIHTRKSIADAWNEQMGRDDADVYLDQTVLLAETVEPVMQEPYPIEMPHLPWAETKKSQAQLLRDLSVKALIERGLDKPAYVAQVQEELDVIVRGGYAGYMLIEYDFMDYCKRNNIFAHARGSVCGSLVAYLLGIHTIDPMRYPIVNFPRFLSKERTDFPDIDIDMDKYRRDQGLKYLADQYGECVGITNYNTWGSRSLLDRMFAVMDIPAKIELELREALQDKGKPSYETLMQDPSLQKIDELYDNVVLRYCNIYGSISTYGIHATGKIFGSPSLRNRIALSQSKKEQALYIETDKDRAEKHGFIKFDVIGSRNCTILSFAERDAGYVFDEELYRDRNLIQHFGSMSLDGIFQFDERAAQVMAWKAKPQSLIDVAIVTACNRPEPKHEKAFEKWLALRKKAYRADLAVFPWEDQYTRGAFIFQEQIRIVCAYAGMTDKQIDAVQKALKRYEEEDNVELRDVFLKGMKARGWSESDAFRLWQSMRHYLFNGGHAAAYAGIAIREMNMKVRYPRSWYYALFKYEDDKEKRERFMREAVSRGICFAPAHVNGDIGFERIKIGRRELLQEGLTSIHGIADAAAQAIREERMRNGDFTSEEDFEQRMTFKYSKVNAGHRAALRLAGALEFDTDHWNNRILEMNKLLLGA